MAETRPWEHERVPFRIRANTLDGMKHEINRHIDWLEKAMREMVGASATSVAGAGGVMDTDFTANGLMKRTGSGTYTTVTDAVGLAVLQFGIDSIAADGYLKTVGGAQPSATEGIEMHRAGSVRGIGICFDWVETTSGYVDFDARIGNAEGLLKEITVDGSGVKTGHATQAEDTDAFSAGDLVQVYIDLKGSTAGTLNDVMVTVEVMYDV